MVNLTRLHRPLSEYRSSQALDVCEQQNSMIVLLHASSPAAATSIAGQAAVPHGEHTESRPCAGKVPTESPTSHKEHDGTTLDAGEAPAAALQVYSFAIPHGIWPSWGHLRFFAWAFALAFSFGVGGVGVFSREDAAAARSLVSFF